MKISSNQIRQIARVYSQNRAAKADTSKPSLGRDSVSLSVQGKETQAIKKKLAEIPSVRHDKVDKLKVAIDSGVYQVSSKEIADKMLGRTLVDVLIAKE